MRMGNVTLVGCVTTGNRIIGFAEFLTESQKKNLAESDVFI